MSVWFFAAAHNVVCFMGRFESETGDIVGHAWPQIGPGESFHGLSYDELRAAGAGRNPG